MSDDTSRTSTPRLTISKLKKIFNYDSNLPLKSTTKSPLDSRRDIDGELARWGIHDVFWSWHLENNRCEITFKLPRDKFYSEDLPIWAHLKAPVIWKRNGRERDWRLSVRLLFWYIRFQMAWVYAAQSSPVIAFLPHIRVDENKVASDVLLPQLSSLKALPSARDPNRKVLDYVPPG